MKKFTINPRRIAAFLGVFIVILVVIQFNTRLEELNRLQSQLDDTAALATQAVQTHLVLQTRVAYAESTAAVEEWARTQGHYVLEGDQPVVPVGNPDSQSAPLPTPRPSATPMQNWQVWLSLFFDEKP